MSQVAHPDYGSVGAKFGLTPEQQAKLEQILQGHVHMVHGTPHIDFAALLQLLATFLPILGNIGPLIAAIQALFHPPAPTPTPVPTP